MSIGIWNYGHPERAFFQKFETFGLGQTNWAEIFWGIWGIFGQTISTILALWVPCPWENLAGSFSYKKLWFLGIKHITPKCSKNKILAVKNLFGEEPSHFHLQSNENDNVQQNWRYSTNCGPRFGCLPQKIFVGNPYMSAFQFNIFRRCVFLLIFESIFLLHNAYFQTENLEIISSPCFIWFFKLLLM